MRTKLFLAILVIASLIQGQAQIIDFTSGQLSNGAQLSYPERTVEQVSDGILLTYKFQTARLLEDEIYPGRYFIEIPGLTNSTDIQHPSLPSFIDRFVVPKESNPTIRLISSKYTDIKLNIAPGREPKLLNDTFQYSTNNVPPIKPYSGFYPNAICEDIESAIYRKQPIARIMINPVQYNYNSGTTRIYTEIICKIVFTTNNNISNIYYEPGSMLNPNCTKAPLAELNTLDYREPGSNVKVNSGYLILSSPSFSYYLSEFIKWKKRLGYNVTSIYDSNWTPEKIKTTVKEQYENDSTLMYLLIVGDHSIVPGQTKTYKPIGDYITDIPYFCLDGDSDREPDLYCGRIPVSTTQQLETVIDKIIWYEQAPPLNENFYKRGSHFSFFEDGSGAGSHNGIEDGRFIKTSEDILCYLTQNYGYNIDRFYSYYTKEDSITYLPSKWNSWYSEGGSIPSELLYENGFKWNSNATDLVNAINNDGVSYVLYVGHGGAVGWGNENDILLDKNNVTQMSNYEQFPVVFNLCCSTGKHDEDDCITRTFLAKKNGGAICSFAATREVYYSDIGRTGALLFNAIWPKPGISILGSNSIDLRLTNDSQPEPIHNLGGILNYYISNVPTGISNINLYKSSIYHCFGDPSMYFRTELPQIIDNIDINRTGTGVNVYTNGKELYIGFYDPTTGKSSRHFGTEASFFSDTKGASKYIDVVVYTPNSIPYTDFGEEYLGGPVEPTTRSQLLGYTDTHDHTTVTINYYLASTDANKKVEILIVDLLTGNIVSQYSVDKSIVNQETSINMYTNQGVMVASLMVDGYPVSNLKMYISKK